jgi:hypothetical protein
MGKLYLKSTGEFIKNCTQREYLELAISTPGEYCFSDTAPPGPTIQDLNNFVQQCTAKANENNKPEIQKPITTTFWGKIKSSILLWAAIVAILTFIILILQMLFKNDS